MIKKNIKYIIVILSIILIIVNILSNSIYATDLGLGELTEYKSEAQMGAAQTKAQSILGVLQIVGVAASVIALIAIGIKYMMGSVEEKAEYKKTFIPYIVGAFLVFAVSILPQVIYDLLSHFH